MIKQFQPCLAGLLFWTIFTICDAIDELAFEVDTCLSAWYIYIIPLFYTFLYIAYWLSHNITVKAVVLWHLKYVITSVALGFGIYILLSNDLWIVPQIPHSMLFNFNGIEYPVMGIIGIPLSECAFLIFHLAHWLIMKKKKNMTS